jgi:hypothetical protein
LRRECHEPRIGTPIALEAHGGFTRLTFGFEKERMPAVTIGETAINQKRILPGRSE